MKNRLRLFLVSILVIFFSGCAKKKHIGKWQHNNSKEQIELLSDGKLQIADGKSIIKGKYAIIESRSNGNDILGKLRMEFEENSYTTIKEFEISASSTAMMLTDANGERKHFRRIQQIE